MARREGTRNMGTKQERELDGEKAAAQRRVEELRGELKRKQKELDELLMRSETLHPSAYGALQGQLEGEIEQLQAELNRLTTVAG
jgi:chromosome segregation ATPase